MLQTEDGTVFNCSEEASDEKVTGCTKSSKLILQIEQDKGKVSLRIDKLAAKVLCTGSDVILGGESLYLVSGLFFKKDRLKIKNVDKLMEKIENKIGTKLQD